MIGIRVTAAITVRPLLLFSISRFSPLLHVLWSYINEIPKIHHFRLSLSLSLTRQSFYLFFFFPFFGSSITASFSFYSLIFSYAFILFFFFWREFWLMLMISDGNYWRTSGDAEEEEEASYLLYVLFLSATLDFMFFLLYILVG